MKKRGSYISVGRFSISHVLDQVISSEETKKLRNDGFKPGDNEWKETCEKEFDGHLVKMTSMRYRLFKEKGTNCAKCGLLGVYFSLERHSNDKDGTKLHFNLYGVNSAGETIMFTKDHIAPKAKGGSNALDNLQTMCTWCNSKKADNL